MWFFRRSNIELWEESKFCLKRIIKLILKLANIYHVDIPCWYLSSASYCNCVFQIIIFGRVQMKVKYWKWLYWWSTPRTLQKELLCYQPLHNFSTVPAKYKRSSKVHFNLNGVLMTSAGVEQAGMLLMSRPAAKPINRVKWYNVFQVYCL